MIAAVGNPQSEPFGAIDKAPTDAREDTRSRDIPVNLTAFRSPVLPAVVFVSAVALAFLRRPETLTSPAFWNEDGQIFFLGTWYSTPLTSYAGYLHLFPRLAAYLERLAPIELAPLIGNGIALLVMAAVGAFIASDVLPGDRGLRSLLGLFVVLSPLSSEVAGSLTYVQWYLAIFLFVFRFAVRPSRRWVLPLAISGLTGPFSIVAAPLYAIRAWRDPSFRPFAVTMLATAAIQGVTAATSRRWLDSPPGDVPQVLALRLVVAPVLGQHWAELLAPLAVLLGAALLVPLALAARRIPAPVLFVAGYVIATFTIAALLLRPDGGDLRLVRTGERYFFLPATALGFVVIIGSVRRRMGRVALALLIVGCVSDFRLEPHQHDPGWAIRWPASPNDYEPWHAGLGRP
jgi:hypothetical protein